ncbi:MAG: membrane protein insertion efficiency factor YidD [Deltaproteobacteria bacterium]|nr:membrane protein insertion efficiency factor YidD [Deltaproteobacteria bacterium]
MLRAPLIAAIRAYQWLLRPLSPPSCRFHPTCSEYALDAIRLEGAGKGFFLTLHRILRCHPWNPGGFDPVLSSPVPAERALSPRPRQGGVVR